MDYWARIRELREDKDLSQKHIADFLGVAQTTYSQYELGRRPIPVEFVIALCKYHNVSSDYLLGLSNKK